MTLNQEILQPIIDIHKNFSHVSLNEENIKNIIEIIGETAPSDWKQPYIFNDKTYRSLNYLALFSCLSFCYWNSPKWGRNYKGIELGGSNSLFYALTEAISNGFDITDAKVLHQMSYEEFYTILKGNSEEQISFIEERYSIARSFGKVLDKVFKGNFVPALEKVSFNAGIFHKLLIDNFDILHDSHKYRGIDIKFYKKSQEIVTLIFEQFQGKGLGRFNQMEDLTASSDYKLPQILRNYNVIEYSKELESKITGFEILLDDSEEALEIRMITILACHIIAKFLKRKGICVREFEISNILWTLSQRPSANQIPHPRILSIYV